MRVSAPIGLAFAVCAGSLWGCGGGWTQSSPSSPSSLSLDTPLNIAGRISTVQPRHVDSDGDGYEDAPEGMPPPAPEAPPPNPDVPAPDAPVPITLTVNIVAPFGPGAFVPNPLQAAIGNTIVWTNSDLIPHIIVLDDGTPVGDLAPGQSSLPISLSTETMGYHCTLHPTMVGQITTVVPGEPVPSDGSQNPPADPSTAPPANPSDDGYADDYYLRSVR